MKTTYFLAFAVAFAIVGCQDSKPTPPAATTADTKLKSELDKLSAEDKALAEAQRVCPVTDQELGSMGAPIKVMVKDKPVMICCKSCESKVLAKPDAMLQKVEELKSQVGGRR